jgi:hypothetical protein
MKTTVKLLSLIMLPAALMLACATTEDRVSMISAASEIEFAINADATNISIDWGDGTTSSTDDGKRYGRLEFYHEYTI